MTRKPQASHGTSPVIGRIAIPGAVLVALLGYIAGGCASLSPSESASAGQVRVFADRVARAYGLSPIHLLVSRNPDAPPGSFQRGFFTVSTGTLGSSLRDAIVAHELAHYVLGHGAPLPGDTPEQFKSAYQQRELDANAKSVEILSRVLGMSQREALRAVYRYLRIVHLAFEEDPRLDLAGHRPPCDEIADLLRRFPEHRDWTADLECAPSDLWSSAAAP